MKPNDPLARLLRAAARAEREAAPAPAEIPFGFETRVLAARRSAGDLMPFLPLFRGALACSAVIAVLCASVYFQRVEPPDAYEFTLNHSLAVAYME